MWSVTTSGHDEGVAPGSEAAASNSALTLPREVRVLVVVAFCVALGFGIVAPALPVFARDFGVGRAAAGAVISAFAVMRIGFSLPAGKLVDRIGERLVLAIGIGIVAVSSALAGLAGSYWQLVVLRGIGGVGSAMFSIAAMSLLVRMVPSATRGRAVGLWQGGFLLGGITGPALGGVVTGISIRLPFFLYAGTLAMAGTVAMVALRHTPLADRDDPATSSRTTLGTALRDPAYRAALIANFADSWGAIGIRSALIPLFVHDVLHRSFEWTGIGFLIVSAVNAATLWPAGQYADRVGRRPLLIVGTATSGVGIGVLAIAPNLAGYLIGLGLLGLGSGMLDVAPAAVVGDIVDGRGGPVFATFAMSADVGTVFGPVVAGRIADSSYPAAFLTTAAILFAATVFSIASPETRGRAHPTRPIPAEPAVTGPG
jgi:DHA1 family multidrug resistance protein-like MFS transporter